MRASDTAFITKILQMCCRKIGIAIFSFIRTNFLVEKKAKKSQKGKHIFKGQLTWDESKKSQKAN